MIRLTKIGISMAIDMLSHPSSCDESDIRIAVIDAIAGLKELQHYKDLEEQGRLIELPCKVGDAIYWIDESYLGKYTIRKTEFSYFWLEHEFFTTKEEAEEALKRLRGNE